MRLLLDTHVILWGLQDDPHLKPGCRDLISDPNHEVFYSIASVWEICIKIAKGNLVVPDDLQLALEYSMFRQLPIKFEHALEIRALPLHHRDPFDRMLIAQARIENLTLVTRDPRIQKYDVQTMEA